MTDDPPKPPAPRFRRRVQAAATIAGVAVAAFLIGLMLFNDLVMPRLVHRINEQRIPDLTNLNLEQAGKVLSARGLVLTRSGERFDAAVPSGFIVSQDPPPETPYGGRKRVSVVVSLGEEFSSVPALFGESMRTAAYLLSRSGLKLGGITHAPSEDVGDGLIASSDPPAESVLPRNTPVAVMVSTGGVEESFVMPDVLGREIRGVRRQLESYGFRVFTPPAAPGIGTIIHQQPPPGSRITRRTQILIQATGRLIR
jgi:eukaryotic-like serine/threonine-protein kinase